MATYVPATPTSRLNVHAFGAVGDGIHDDTAAIQAALDQGGDVYIPLGTYNISTPLSVRAGTVFHGVSSANTNLVYSGTDSALVIAESAQNVMLQNLSVTYPNNAGTSGGAIEVSNDCFLIAIQNIYTSGGYNGLQIDNQVNTIYVQNVHCTGNYAGLFCQSGADVSNSVFRGGQVGIQLDSTSGAFNCDQSAFYGPLGMWTTNTLGVQVPNIGIWMWNAQFNIESGTSPTGTSLNVFLDAWGGEVHFFGCWATGSVVGLQANGAVYGVPFLEVVGGSWSGFEFSNVGDPNTVMGVILNGINIEGPGNGTAITIANNTSWFIVKGCIIRSWNNGIVVPSGAGGLNGPFTFADNQFINVSTKLTVGASEFYNTAIFTNNLGFNPVGSISPPDTPLVSGTVYQNQSMVPFVIYQPAYATASGTAGTVAVALGPASTPPTIFTKQIPGTTSSAAPDLVEIRVPAGWYYSFTASAATLATATIMGE
jgi:hypothetical protein